jgi:hypothetical protein
MEHAKDVETSYQALLQERREWNVLFRDIAPRCLGW